MEEQFNYDEEEALRGERWKEKIAEMKRQKERRERLNQYIKQYAVYGCVSLLAIIIIGTGIGIHRKNVKAKEPITQEAATQETVVQETIPQETVDQKEAIQVTPEALAQGTVEGVLGGTKNNSIETTPEGREASYIEDNSQMEVPIASDEIAVGDVMFHAGYVAEATESTRAVGQEDVLSEYAILIDAGSDTIVAQREAKTIINPASMTKILTVLVAAEHVTNLDDEFTITLQMTDYAYVNDCSSVGFLDGETVTVRDLFYGTVLPSGGDAAVALATYVAGSQEAFVELMNAKAEELGLSETAHFTNCVGIYDENHYCTVYDMAMILKAAVENDLCREVLSAHTYTTSATEQHPEGITISNWFLRRIEDKETGGEVLCAKTGYVNQAGSCAASYAISDDGTPYICVTAKTYSSWRCIYDHVAMYSLYTQ